MTKSELGRVYSDGEIIYREGDDAEVMYVIQDGKVNITRKYEFGELNIATLEKGDIFGEIALFNKVPRSATATASGSAKILSIDRKNLFSFINKDPTIVFKMLENMSNRIRQLDVDVTQLKKSTPNISRGYEDINNTCHLILEETKLLVQSDNGSIMILDRMKKDLAIKAAFGYEAKSKMKLTHKVGIAGNVLTRGNAEMVNNVAADSRFITGEFPIHSMICIPLKDRMHNFGVINLSNSSEKIFSPEDFKFLISLGTYASVAIRNAQYFADLNAATNGVLKEAIMLDTW